MLPVSSLLACTPWNHKCTFSQTGAALAVLVENQQVEELLVVPCNGAAAQRSLQRAMMQINGIRVISCDKLTKGVHFSWHVADHWYRNTVA